MTNNLYSVRYDERKRRWSVHQDDRCLGTVSLYDNTFHPYNQYFKFHVCDETLYDTVGRTLLEMLIQQSNRSLQYSLMSDDEAMIRLLCDQGFIRKRRCWEFSFERKHLVNVSPMALVRFSQLNEGQYERVKRLIVHQYKTVHESVNPVNQNLSDRECFDILCEKLSMEESFCYENQDAFYYCCVEKDGANVFVTYFGYEGFGENYGDFLMNVCNTLLKKYDTIEFEVDDVNPYAMMMQRWVDFTTDVSYDAYIRVKG